MRSPFARVVRRSVKAGGNMASQVIVSVAAAVCVGFITNAYLERKPAPEQPSATAEASDRTAGNKGAIRVVAEPMGNSIGGHPAHPLPVTPVSPVKDAAESPVAPPLDDVADTGPAALPPLTPQIISDLPVRDVAAPGAEIFPGVPAESTLAESLRNPAPAAEPKRERRHFLGLPLPFMPSASELIGSATAAGGKIVSIVER